MQFILNYLREQQTVVSFVTILVVVSYLVLGFVGNFDAQDRMKDLMQMVIFFWFGTQVSVLPKTDKIIAQKVMSEDT